MPDGNRWSLRLDPQRIRSLRAQGVWSGKTIADHAAERAAKDPQAPVYMSERGILRAGELLERAGELARGLAALGLRPGDTLAFQLPNWDEVAVINLAAALGGYVLNPVVPIYRGGELRFLLRDSRARIMFAPCTYRGFDFASMIQGLRPDLPDLAHVVTVRDSAPGALRYDDLLAEGRNSQAPLPGSDPAAPKQVIYTSGTTGPAKGVIYTHEQARCFLANSYAAWGLDSHSTCLIGTPVTHVSGMGYGIDAPLYLGIRALLMERWDPAEAVRLIDTHRIDMMVGATPFLSDLLAAAQASGSRLPSLRTFPCGGAAVPPGLVLRAREVLENCRCFRVFGSSECPMITQGCPNEPELGATTDGRIMGYEVKIVDDDGRSLPPGAEGEILARGPAMFAGYTDPVATAESFDAEGYFRSGDMGRVTADGVLTVTGRKKDLIIRGGENLSAKEIEDALHTHPAIREAAAVSMPHPRLVETVCVFLIPSGTDRPDTRELAEFLRSRELAPQKWPERVEYVDDLPRTASGKVQKHLLRARIAEMLGAGAVR